ncbi:DUF3102 domain-containing protein [Cytobacillus sp. FSL M8-0252]|uniref:DUF3102 domain-containing protein n=1 Tax=Cytobacillus sp. FSL M8-0252 TaxID=2921621 RepID=UPI0030F58115
MNEIKGGGASVELSTDLNVITAEINAYQRVAGEAVFEIGYRLKHVKEKDLAHGEWSEWLEKMNMTQGHARRFIRVYDRFAKHAPVHELPPSLSVLYLLIPFDDEELEKPREMPNGSTKKLTEMSRREIEEFKAREKKALLVAEEAENQRAFCQHVVFFF